MGGICEARKILFLLANISCNVFIHRVSMVYRESAYNIYGAI